ncbi:type II restriction endonuclease [uncultured Methanobrevibacter sp.]|uniref:type II restriction endonuclease n=1 Tax=uncultured Methanobrevibacter sp. TaxID=253161 RepID=UPI002627E457|nr:type II restriction endonuclease [uncultured Methanobrevibacter sp.]
MVNYSKLGYSSRADYESAFYETLLETNRTHDFYVDWGKIFGKLEDTTREINILNTLVDSSDVENDFRKIILEHPKVISVLPSILAIREKNIAVLDEYEMKCLKVSCSKRSPSDIGDIVDFSEKTGLLNLFNNIRDLKSYLMGVEVGLDTNARKNRSGHIFEKIVGDLLKKKIKDFPDLTISAEETLNFERTKRLDFVIHKNDVPKFLFECNFYASSGSKPIEVANAYIDLNKQIKEQDMVFVWITDGFGWKKMYNAFHEASTNIDFVLNFNMLNDTIYNLLDD